jgi:hypothetical protein
VSALHGSFLFGLAIVGLAYDEEKSVFSLFVLSAVVHEKSEFGQRLREIKRSNVLHSTRTKAGVVHVAATEEPASS